MTNEIKKAIDDFFIITPKPINFGSTSIPKRAEDYADNNAHIQNLLERVLYRTYAINTMRELKALDLLEIMVAIFKHHGFNKAKRNEILGAAEHILNYIFEKPVSSNSFKKDDDDMPEELKAMSTRDDDDPFFDIMFPKQ